VWGDVCSGRLAVVAVPSDRARACGLLPRLHGQMISEGPWLPKNPPGSKTRRTTFSDSSKSTGLEIVIPQRQTDMFYQFSARPRFLRSQHSMQTSFIARMLHEFIGAPAHHQLRELGWTEEQNLRIDICWGAADLDRARSCAAKLVNLAFACWSCTTPTTSQVLAMYASSRP